MDFTQYWNIVWTLTFGLTGIIVTIGNLLTVGIFLKQKLRKRPHFLPISLAVADLMVGALAIPLYIAVGKHLSDRLLVLSFQCVDIFTGVLSIFTLSSISLERMHAIIWPLRHRTLTSRFYITVIGIPWILAVLGILIRVLLHFFIISRMSFVVTIIVSLTTPLLFTCIAYFLIWRKQKYRFQNAQQEGRDEKLTKTLFLITSAFVLTWLPFHIINIVVSFCLHCQRWPYFVFHIMKLLQFSNSFINVIIYPLRILEYKEALIMIFSCAKAGTDRRQGRRTLSHKSRSHTSPPVYV